MLKKWDLLRDKASDVPQGGSGYESETQGGATPPEKAQATQADGDKTNNAASDKNQSTSKTKQDKSSEATDESKQAGATTETEGTDQATGYEKPPEVPEKNETEQVEDYQLNLEGVAKEVSSEILDFAKKNKLSKEQAQALVEYEKKLNLAGTKAAQQQAELIQQKDKEQRAQWGKELREDKVFGGQNFDKNLKQVEKLLHDFMPETKKHLTTNKGMLPPIVMRDLHKIAEKLYETDRLVTGNPVDAEKTHNPWDFYG